MGSRDLRAIEDLSCTYYIGRTNSRLINTPGIGPGDGITRVDIVRRDDTIRSGILSTLMSFDKLRGILILLNSNHPHLTVSLRCCVEGLLAPLDRCAVRNVVLGFTNPRHSNYTLGDTFIPLQTLFEEYADVGLSLSRQTVYCFDSVSFISRGL